MREAFISLLHRIFSSSLHSLSSMLRPWRVVTSDEVAQSNKRIYGSTRLNISKRETRLLEIHPGNFDAELECTLFKASLDDGKVYQALSYHWGDATRRGLVTVNEQAISITVNLEVALRHLRHRDLTRIYTSYFCVCDQCY